MGLPWARRGPELGTCYSTFMGQLENDDTNNASVPTLDDVHGQAGASASAHHLYNPEQSLERKGPRKAKIPIQIRGAVIRRASQRTGDGGKDDTNIWHYP